MVLLPDVPDITNSTFNKLRQATCFFSDRNDVFILEGNWKTFLGAKYLRVRLTVVCVQCIFAPRSAHSVCGLARVRPDVSVRVVGYQQLSSLQV